LKMKFRKVRAKTERRARKKKIARVLGKCKLF
jgi:hypothetical protein